MTTLRNLTAVAVLAIAGFSQAAPLTIANFDQRTTVRNISFSDLSFADATDLVSTRFDIHGGIGDTGTFGFTGLGPPTTGFSVTGGAGVSISGVVPPNAAGTALFTATVVGLSDQRINVLWLNQSGPPGQGFTLTHDTSSGFHTLVFSGGGGGFVRAGGQFVFSAMLPGNWSSLGTGVGQTEFLGISPDFTVTQNFSYQPATNTTVFEAINPNFNPSFPNVQAHFVLHGAPVPEPASAVLFLFGLAALGGVCVRRSRRV